jgi:hypothetical protein
MPLLQVWRGQEETSRVSRFNKLILPASGSNFFAKLCPIFGAWRLWPIRPLPGRHWK